MGEPVAGQMGRARLREALGKWRDNLIDLSGRNRLLSFRHTRTATLAIKCPAAGPLIADLDAGLRFAALPEGDSEGEDPTTGAPDGGIVTQKTTQPSLDAALRKLYRDSNQIFNDTGLWTLQLGAGFLKWREPGAEGFNSAPLLLIPVRLDRLGPGAYRLITEDSEEGTPNPALAVKMAQLGFEWPDPDNMKDLLSTLTAVRAAVAGRPGWEVAEDVVLATFRSHKEAMYRDLLDHEDQILAHPLVQAIGLGADAALPDDLLDFDPVDIDRIDEVQPPEETPLVLDADSSQRQCVAAALDGRSFLMDGPPGTGKSQTIANMIAALMHQGRSVLFVSEKAAALDVVRNRLDAVGLGAFVLSLHSHHASRKEVARALGDALSRRPKAAGGDLVAGRRRLLQTREGLSAYAAAMNEIRPSLGLSLHDAIGRVSALGTQNVPLLTTAVPDQLTPEGFQEVLAAAEEMGDSWRPATEGAAFPWRDLAGRGSPQAALHLLRERADALLHRMETHSRLAEPLGLDGPGAAERLLSLLDATADQLEVPVTWLTSPSLPGLRAAIGEFTARLESLRDHTAAVTADVGPAWDHLPAGLPADMPADERALADMAVEGLELAELDREQLERLAAEFRFTAEMLRRIRTTLADIAAVYGVPGPETYEESLALCMLTDFARRQARSEAAWLSDAGRTAAAHAVADLQARAAALAEVRAVASQVFTEKILSFPDFPILARRFGETHRLGKLSSTYRSDKRALAGLTISGKWTKDAAERLPHAMAWHEAATAFQQAASVHGPALGRYWNGEHTDFRLVRELLDVSAQIVRLAAGLRDPSALAGQVAADGTPDIGLCATADEIRAQLETWQRTLVPAPELGGRPRLKQGALTDTAEWYSAHLQPIDTALELLAATGQPTPARARHVIARANSLRAQRETFLSHASRDETLLGSLHDGLETDTALLSTALAWVTRVRDDGTPMPEAAAQALLTSGPDEELHRLWSAFRAAATDFVHLFDGPRRRQVHVQIMGTTEQFYELVDLLTGDRSGPDEWNTFRRGLAVLRRYGFDGLSERAAKHGADGASFRQIVERALLQAWIEQVMVTDSRLEPVRAVERDRQVQLFQELDKALVVNAHAQVIETCNARRPRATSGEGAIIMREAEKKSRHMPVRTLLERTSNVVPRVKPCFMMSPLTVSQFLPPGYRFDVVIFDEASQVLPQDAINCVYRGNSLIVAGDQKQLPPTDFFSQSDDSDEDEYDEDVPDSFESLLDMCKASGLLKSLSLNWHYRSRHEGLIAFSNRKFYKNSLVTFPGAHESGEDVGVTFTKVPGVYERGQSRRNPIEAKAVAERVMHHYTTRPHLSLGVVAMSDAQAQAIEDAVDSALRERSELERFFSEDRLNGFFVKNLETVQGDERDVIILSVGYGPDQNGRLTMGFGPLNRENGWRRLNVAVTRARHRVEVIASVSGADIRDDGNKSRGFLKKYLDYSEHGPAVLDQELISTDAAPESPFEESVLDVLLREGYDVQPQVGVAGYRIDMAVRHPAYPGRFALGIECDGAMYHSSKAARDRDRLREEVLRGLGWTLYRIWGTDWYRDRPQAEARLLDAIQAAIGVSPEERPRTVDAPAEVKVTMESDDGAQVRAWAGSYRCAPLTDVSYQYDLHEPESRKLLGLIFARILEVETPIHREQLYRRAASVWFADKITQRRRRNLDKALDEFLRTASHVERDGDILTWHGRPVFARQPGDGISRKVAEIPLTERKVALIGLIGESPGINEAELTTLTARFFGWNRRGPEIARALSQDLRELQEQGRVQGVPERITLVEDGIGPGAHI